MDINVFKRNVSLSKLGICELNYDEKIVYEFLLNNFSNLKYEVHISTKCVIFYQDTDDILLSYTSLLSRVYTNKGNLFNSFRRLTNMNISTLLEWWVNISLDINVRKLL